MDNASAESKEKQSVSYNKLWPAFSTTAGREISNPTERTSLNISTETLKNLYFFLH